MLFVTLFVHLLAGVVAADSSRRTTDATSPQEQASSTNTNNNTAHARALQACSLAKSAFAANLADSESGCSATSTVLTPSCSAYSSRIQVPWSDNCWQNSTCIVSPVDNQSVAKLLEIVSTANATFSVRSGGHNFNVNSSSVGQSGLLIDMVHFNSIQLSEDKSTIKVGAGTRWGDVYDYLNGTGVSVNGARSPNPAVAGQTLGGGIGWLSGLVGPTAASLVGAEIVLANGSILTIDETRHADLLWALRGGGPNFGVIISLTYRTLAIDKMWFASNLYTHDKNQQLLNALVEYQTSNNDSKASIVYQLSEVNTTAGSFVGFLYTDPDVAWPASFSPFDAIEASSTLISPSTGTLADLSAHYYNPQYPEAGTIPTRNYVVSLPHKVDNATYQESYAAFQTLAAVAIANGWIMNYGAQPISAAAALAASNTPLNLMAMDQDWVHVTMQWSSPADDDGAMALIDQMGEAISHAADAHGSTLEFRFMNDANSDQKVLSSYGSGMTQRLREISHKYDPERLFQRLQNGGWLLRSEGLD